MKRVRVLRLLEYIYDSAELMVTDMARWGVKGAHVVVGNGGGMVIKSATLPPEILADEQETK